MAGFLDRIDDVNRSDFLYSVSEAYVFGSYAEADAAQDFGDIDLVVKLEPRLLPGEDCRSFIDREVARADASGKSLPSFFDRLFYARNEVLRFLKARKSHLSFSSDDLEKLRESKPEGWRCRQVFPR
jgi:predicted nucleotidyltransferase